MEPVLLVFNLDRCTQDDLAKYGKDDLIAEALRNEASDLR